MIVDEKSPSRANVLNFVHYRSQDTVMLSSLCTQKHKIYAFSNDCLTCYSVRSSEKISTPDLL